MTQRYFFYGALFLLISAWVGASIGLRTCAPSVQTYISSSFGGIGISASFGTNKTKFSKSSNLVAPCWLHADKFAQLAWTFLAP